VKRCEWKKCEGMAMEVLEREGGRERVNRMKSEGEDETMGQNP